jgi:two-component system, LytTR family, response regulator
METIYTYLIADDEHPAHEVIEILLQSFPNLKLEKRCYNGEEALTEINTNKYDIVFLDVNMPKLNGIELLEKVPQKPAVIITTAYNNFAFEAYQNDAVDYLQKPISTERLAKAMAKAIAYAKEKRAEKAKYIILKVDGISTKVKQDDILYMRSMVNHSKYYVKNRVKPILINEAFSKQLPKLDNDLFIQTHRTCIVNKTCIKGRKESELIIENNILLPIGRKYINTIQKLLIELM